MIPVARIQRRRRSTSRPGGRPVAALVAAIGDIPSTGYSLLTGADIDEPSSGRSRAVATRCAQVVLLTVARARTCVIAVSDGAHRARASERARGVDGKDPSWRSSAFSVTHDRSPVLSGGRGAVVLAADGRSSDLGAWARLGTEAAGAIAPAANDRPVLFFALHLLLVVTTVSHAPGLNCRACPRTVRWAYDHPHRAHREYPKTPRADRGDRSTRTARTRCWTRSMRRRFGTPSSGSRPRARR